MSLLHLFLVGGLLIKNNPVISRGYFLEQSKCSGFTPKANSTAIGFSHNHPQTVENRGQ